MIRVHAFFFRSYLQCTIGFQNRRMDKVLITQIFPDCMFKCRRSAVLICVKLRNLCICGKTAKPSQNQQLFNRTPGITVFEIVPGT